MNLFRLVPASVCALAFSFAFALSFEIVGCSFASAQDWPQFLGPNGSAHCADVAPTSWNESENMLWKLDLPGAGSSSPIIVGDRVFVTCYAQANGKLKRQTVCVDKNTGKQLWAKEIPAEYREDAYRGYLTEHGYASNTPVSDGQHVFVFFGKGGVHSYDLEGNLKWSVEVGKESSQKLWGSASSLLLDENRLIVNAAEESRSIIALNKSTGEELWRQESGMLSLTYGTPRLVNLKNGKKEIVISVPSEIWALRPESGKLNWYAKTPMTGNISPSVIVDGETVYSFGGYRSSGSVSFQAGGDDDVSKTRNNWTSRTSSYVATPLLHEGRLYWIDDRGLAKCVDAKTGAEVYKERVSGLTGRPVYASPVLIGGKIYVVTRRGGTIVYAPGDKFQPLETNKIAGDGTDFNASPAVSNSRIYLRSNQSLYCIGK